MKSVNKDARLIRYADDFVILHKDLVVVQKCQQYASQWLRDMGLELKPSKTRLIHTLEKFNGEDPGFDFLGFTVRQFPVGKYQSGTDRWGNKLGFKTIIKPSKQKIKLHSEELSKIIDTHKTAPQIALISRLNPVIRGSANYYSSVVSKEIFSEMGMLTYQKLRAWANRRHPNKDHEWVANKYWHTFGNETWVFATKGEGKKKQMRLRAHFETKILRHVKVKECRSP